MTSLGKRSRASPTASTSLPKPVHKRLKLNPPKRRSNQQQPPSPLPLHYYLLRGIVPMLATQPEQRFNWHSAANIHITTRHSTNKPVLLALKSLIKSGRSCNGSTPGITIKKAKERVIRYEYWPVFDEYADEDDRCPRTKTEEGKELGQKLARELAEFFYRPAHIPETVDFC